MIEQKTYKNKELALLIGVNPNAAHLKKDIEKTLTFIGIEFDFPKNGYTEILRPPILPEEEIRYYYKLMKVDPRVDIKQFSIYIFKLTANIFFQYLSFAQQASYLRKTYNIDIKAATLRNWKEKYLTKENEKLIHNLGEAIFDYIIFKNELKRLEGEINKCKNQK